MERSLFILVDCYVIYFARWLVRRTACSSSQLGSVFKSLVSTAVSWACAMVFSKLLVLRKSEAWGVIPKAYWILMKGIV